MTETFATTDVVKVAVMTGMHPFDVPGFTDLFRNLTGVLSYPQTLESFVQDVGGVRTKYDVLVFYNFHQDTPDPARGEADRRTFEALTQLGETAQGILVLHHALVAFDHWPYWDELIGGLRRNHGYAPDQHLRVHVADPVHPVTRGMADFDLVDETYPLGDARPEDGNTILLTTDHPGSMRTLAWTRQHRNTRVMCWQSGHDGAAWTNPVFTAILSRGIQWLARRLQ